MYRISKENFHFEFVTERKLDGLCPRSLAKDVFALSFRDRQAYHHNSDLKYELSAQHFVKRTP